MIPPQRKMITPQMVCQIFNINPSDLPDVTSPQPIPELKQAIRDFRRILRTAYRKLAFEDHPDKGGTGERMKVAGPIYKDLMKIIKVTNISRQVIRPRPTVIKVYRSSGMWTSTSSTTSSTTGGTGWW